jgi:hypothetical protein
MVQLLQAYIKELLKEEQEVRGYVKPEASFKTLEEWVIIANSFLSLQRLKMGTRAARLEDPTLKSLVINNFGYQYSIETSRYDLLTKKNVLDFIEDFANHRLWAFEREYSSYFPDISKLRFAYFYSRGDMEPYVLLDEEFTLQLYGSIDNRARLKHFTTFEGSQRILRSIDSGNAFDISCFTYSPREYFNSASDHIVELIGNVRAAFRSDVKSTAVDSGRRACNMYRLEYPGDDLDNICRDISDCGKEGRTSLWNEYIATPDKILSVRKIN